MSELTVNQIKEKAQQLMHNADAQRKDAQRRMLEKDYILPTGSSITIRNLQDIHATNTGIFVGMDDLLRWIAHQEAKK